MIARCRTRWAFTLFEMLMVIAGLTIILSLCGGLLHALLRLDRAGRESFRDSTTLSRLARQFRQDVRGSEQAKPGDAGALELDRPDGIIVMYRRADTRLIREESDGNDIKRIEEYDLRRLGPASFAVDGSFVRLVLSRRPTNLQAPARPAVAIEAFLDKDRARKEAPR